MNSNRSVEECFVYDRKMTRLRRKPMTRNPRKRKGRPRKKKLPNRRTLVQTVRLLNPLAESVGGWVAPLMGNVENDCASC